MKNGKQWRGAALIILGVIIMVIETVYFGMNATAQSPAELIWDAAYAILIIIGAFLGAYDWVDYINEKLVLKIELPDRLVDVADHLVDEQTSI